MRIRINRRGFLKAAAIPAIAGAAGCKVLERGYPESSSVEKPPVPGAASWQPGEERFLKSACLQCPGGCGIVVRVVEGRAVKIDGNPAFPTNQGGLCPKGQNGLQVLYDPDRVKWPLRRVGERGSGKWARISWEEATSEIARRLAALRAEGEAQSVAFLGGRYRGHMRPLVQRFLKAYGSPNDIDAESLCSGGEIVHDLTQGVRERLAYDWERTRYVLVFGAGFIESFVPTAMMLRVHGQMRSGRPGERAKVVQIEPRCGVSAARADEWVCLKPGTDGALALGIAHVLIRDGLYDKGFVAQHVLGFTTWRDRSGREHQGFKELVMAHYAPAEVSKLTGVSAARIERLAREFAANGPAVAVFGRGAAAHTNGIYAGLAIHSLNALVGSIGKRGGVLVQRRPPFAEWPAPELDEAARRGLGRPRVDLADGAPPLAASRMSRLHEPLESGKPYPIKALFLYYTNPLFSAPDPARLRAAMSKVPLLVSFSPFLDESTAMADLVLPDHTYLERWQLDETPPSVGYPLFSVRQPVVEPLHETRSTGEVLIQIARAIGAPVGRAFPQSELDMIKGLVRGVHASGRGSIRESQFDDFWTKLLSAGGWWDPPYPFADVASHFRTPSGKYELYATKLEEAVGASARKRHPDLDTDAARTALLSELGIAARGDEAFLPHHEPVRAAAPESEYPFVLNTYKTMTHAEGRGGNQPHLQELFGVQFDRCWEPWVEIHPEDARALGVEDGDEVVLRAPGGEARVKAVLYDGTCRGVLSMPYEYGHTAYGRFASGRGANVNALVGRAVDGLAGVAARYDARVAVRKA